MNNIINNYKKVIGKIVPELSNNEDSMFYFSYKVKIENMGSKKVQLLSRHWDIKDSLGIEGQSILSHQLNLYCNLSIKVRSILIKNIFEDLSNN